MITSYLELLKQHNLLEYVEKYTWKGAYSRGKNEWIEMEKEHLNQIKTNKQRKRVLLSIQCAISPFTKRVIEEKIEKLIYPLKNYKLRFYKNSKCQEIEVVVNHPQHEHLFYEDSFIFKVQDNVELSHKYVCDGLKKWNEIFNEIILIWKYIFLITFKHPILLLNIVMLINRHINKL